jgi:Domain of unknown function (DUF5916)/Carbohydrate family 9 binding domain-like
MQRRKRRRVAGTAERVVGMGRTAVLSTVLLAAVLAPASAMAQAPRHLGGGDADVSNNASHFQIRAVRIKGESITLDGLLNEPAWASADSASSFTQLRPDPGKPASQRTVVRVLYDDDALYIGARMYDTHPDSIVARLVRRDDKGYSDWFAVGVDSYDDQRTAFAFMVNPRGVRVDEMIYDDTNEDVNWDAVWEATSHVDSLGWTTEIRIPLSQLRYAAGPDAPRSWGIDFYREIARRGEESFWAPMDPKQSKLVSAFGTLLGMRNLPSPARLEVAPYGVAKLDRAPGDSQDPFYHANALSGSAGADLKYGVTPDLTLTATINPDFGQVEADPSVVNLTAYETFFPEKRPFFTEGADIFHFGIGFGDGSLGNEQLFYSRRIGRAPHLGLPDSADYGSVPDATTIIGAAKLSGKTSSGWSIGALDAVTASESAPFATAGGDRGRYEVEPLTNYAVGRVIKDFQHGQSAVGGIFTATNRRLDALQLDSLDASAFAGGFNARHRWDNGTYQVSAFLLGSLIRGSTGAISQVQESPGHYFQRPDAGYLGLDTLRTSLAGAAAQLQVAKISGNWTWVGVLHTISPSFEVNDLGFQTQSNLFVQIGSASYNHYTSGHVFRSWGLNLNGWHGTTYGGEETSLGANINGHFQLQSYWSGYGGIERDGAVLSTDALRGGPALQQPTSWNFFGGLYSDSRKPLQAGLDLGGNVAEGEARRSFYLSPNMFWRVAPQIELSLAPSINWNLDPAQYVTQADVQGTNHYYFGRIAQTTVSMTTRLNYTFSPTLSLQLYAQPFVSAGGYRNFKEVVDPKAHGFDQRFHDLTPSEIRYDAADTTYFVNVDGMPDAVSFGNPDFNFKQMRSTAVLRWEYTPGSTLYLVWSQSRTGTDTNGGFDVTRDFGRLLGGGSSITGRNVFLIKVSYWMGK